MFSFFGTGKEENLSVKDSQIKELGRTIMELKETVSDLVIKLETTSHTARKAEEMVYALRTTCNVQSQVIRELEERAVHENDLARTNTVVRGINKRLQAVERHAVSVTTNMDAVRNVFAGISKSMKGTGLLKRKRVRDEDSYKAPPSPDPTTCPTDTEVNDERVLEQARKRVCVKKEPEN